MSMENEMTAKVYGRILAEGMHLADCNLENKIESRSMEVLKKIKTVVMSGEESDEKVKKVENILIEFE